jgi:hypothetical protein
MLSEQLIQYGLTFMAKGSGSYKPSSSRRTSGGSRTSNASCTTLHSTQEKCVFPGFFSSSNPTEGGFNKRKKGRACGNENIPPNTDEKTISEGQEKYVSLAKLMAVPFATYVEFLSALVLLAEVALLAT